VQALVTVHRDIKLNKFPECTPPSSSTGSLSPANSASGSNKRGSPMGKLWDLIGPRPRRQEDKDFQEEEDDDEDDGKIIHTNRYLVSIVFIVNPEGDFHPIQNNIHTFKIIKFTQKVSVIY
jgi:hypothetical protein